MAKSEEFILGEFRRVLDDRFRVSIPADLVQALTSEGSRCILVKESPGSLSLWNSATWESKLRSGVDLVQTKMRAGRLEGKLEQVQLLGRLLSTRNRDVEVSERGRLLIPEGFREFLGVDPGEEVLLVGAALCVEIWNPRAWLEFLESRMPEFGKLLDDLAG